jgi:F0F1-type ATP synthase membrane subunit c/vacuolar-type H+-ATPase subunit K
MHSIKVLSSMQKILLVFLTIGIVIFLADASLILAQTTGTGVGITFTLTGQEENGSIICSTTQGYKACDITYDTSILGIVSDTPAVGIMNTTNSDNSHLILSSGKAQVRVNGANGAIKAGDYITTSSTAGVGMKASRNGYVLGTALEDANVATKDDIKTILVGLDIHPTTAFTDSRSNLFELLRQGISAPLLTPLDAFRYVLAALVTVSSFVLAFIYFGRLAKAGVEAIARNPLAHRTIQLSVFIHLGVMVLIFLFGLGIAYLILAI